MTEKNRKEGIMHAQRSHARPCRFTRRAFQVTVRQAGLDEKRARLSKVGEVNATAPGAGLPAVDMSLVAKPANGKKEVLTAEQKLQKQKDR